MKSRDGKSQRREEKKKEDQKREILRRKKIQAGEKVGKSRNTVFFQWFVAPEGRKVGSLKRRARSQLARWEMNNCTPLWREAYFQVETYKTHQVRTTFGSWDAEKSARRFMGSIHWKGFQSSKMRSLTHHLVVVCFCWGTELNNNSWILAISRTKHEAHIDGPYQQTLGFHQQQRTLFFKWYVGWGANSEPQRETYDLYTIYYSICI